MASDRDPYSDADWGPNDEDDTINWDADEQPPVDELFSDFLEELRDAGKESECSCGAEIVGFKNHSNFCPKYKVKPFQT